MIWILLIAGIAGAAAAPFAFSHLWEKRWFRILWWIGLWIAGSIIFTHNPTAAIILFWAFVAAYFVRRAMSTRWRLVGSRWERVDRR